MEKLTKKLLIDLGFDFDSYKDNRCGIMIDTCKGMNYDAVFEWKYNKLYWHIRQGRLPMVKELDSLESLTRFMSVVFNLELKSKEACK